MKNNTKILRKLPDKALVLRSPDVQEYQLVLKNDAVDGRLIIDLQGYHSAITLKLLILSESDNEQNLEIIANHFGKGSVSKILVRTVLSGDGSLSLKARVHIAKTAAKSDSHLEHKVLLLSSNAKAHTLPALEILNDDVKASHAVTVSELDEEQIFYLMSRGFSIAESKSLLIKAFTEELFTKISSDVLLKAMNTK